MSDTTNTAPTTDVAAPASTNTEAKTVATPQAATEAQPRNFTAEINSLLKEAGLKYVVDGKEQVASSIEDLIRNSQRNIPIQQKLAQIENERKQLTPFAQALEALKNGDEETREQIMEALMGGETLNSLAEKRLRRLYQQEKELANLSPRERELQKKLQAQETELQRYNRMRQEQEQARQQEQYKQEVEHYKSQMAKGIGEALKLMDLPDEMNSIAVDFMKPIIRQMLNAGIPLDGHYLAEAVGPKFDALLNKKLSALDGEKLLSYLGKDLNKKYRQALLNQMKAQTPKARVAPGEGEVKGNPAEHSVRNPGKKRFRW